MIAVAELGDGDADGREAGAVEGLDIGLGGVGAAVVEVHEQGWLAGLAASHLEGQGGQDTATEGVVGGVVWYGLARLVR